MKIASEIILQFLTLYIFSTRLKFQSNRSITHKSLSVNIHIKMIGSRNMQTGIARAPIRHTAIAKITLLKIVASCFLNDVMFILVPCCR